ncbi:3,4-dihydroxy-2-butanone-4-phosphate synthase [uncultured Methanocorpusculum sp.]|nr:3,4-dihydroxy-2-butanone-4-phosphate synthase [uncultured Methanocorpusculum sp.]
MIDHVDTTTGISAVERGITARKCIDPNARPEDFRRPGHMFPLQAKDNGVFEREGHTEATVDLMKLARLKEAGLCCEIMADNGEMMRTPELISMAKQYNLTFVTIKDLQAYWRKQEAAALAVEQKKMSPMDC